MGDVHEQICLGTDQYTINLNIVNNLKNLELLGTKIEVYLNYELITMEKLVNKIEFLKEIEQEVEEDIGREAQTENDEKEEISEQLQAELDEFAQQGNLYYDNENNKEKALEVWKKALELIPEPKNIYSQTVWFLSSIGIIQTNEINNSRIIFFYDEEYYNNFWKRNYSYQTWEKIDSKKTLKQKLNIQTNLKEIGFKETINDEDFKYETELWVYGDIEDIK